MNVADATLQAFLDTARVDAQRYDELAEFRTAMRTRRDAMFSDILEAAVERGELTDEQAEELAPFLDAMAVGLGALYRDTERHRLATHSAKRVLSVYFEQAVATKSSREAVERDA